ncbi:MAG TPA: 50S ribosomal protein L6 [Candidatus Jorgensenbacteria bacterium]|uniref:Large ribosomal subunit protein uL6 alpha-beta domain-containing protein n=1 Tax=marine sediment metagenome TaxID=412755 RepID=A0A0F9AZC9_9ZZZZ|nr:50S ribosomal protein L6 [Candidatus Jorgensenbacteria bacterium]
MSRIGRKPIIIPEGVTVSINDTVVMVSGNGNEQNIPVLSGVRPVQEGQTLSFELLENTKQARSNWGTLRALVANAIEGVTKGFQKTLLLEGVGYRINKEGDNLKLELGFSHFITYQKPAGIEFELDGNTKITVKGINKELVGQVTAEIRSFRPVEPYKGKGFRYDDEIVRRKAGKKAAVGAE